MGWVGLGWVDLAWVGLGLVRFGLTRLTRFKGLNPGLKLRIFIISLDAAILWQAPKTVGTRGEMEERIYNIHNFSLKNALVGPYLLYSSFVVLLKSNI